MQFFDLPQQLRVVNARHGLTLVNLHDHYIGRALALYGEYSQLELDTILQWLPAGRDVVEIGANMGSHSLPLARALAPAKRRLLAVEPQPVIFQQLCANLALNHVHNAIALNMACGDAPATLHFNPQDYDSVGNFGAVALRDKAQDGDQRVPSLPLDTLFAQQLDANWDIGLLKIDVEGMEKAVLLGAQQLIARCRPVIYLENDQPGKSQALIEQLWAMGYQLWFHIPPLFNPNNFAQQAQNLYGNKVSINMLCLPKEHPAPPQDIGITDASVHPLKA